MLRDSEVEFTCSLKRLGRSLMVMGIELDTGEGEGGRATPPIPGSLARLFSGLRSFRRNGPGPVKS